MLKIDYTFTALQPIHTGSDENTGTERKLRREKVLLKEPEIYNTKFKDHESRREAILQILYHVWKSIDFEGIHKTRLMTIWDEFSSKVLASTQVRTKEQFLNSICAKMGIRTLANEFSDKVPSLLELFNDSEFLQTLRDELQYLILKLRIKVKKEKQSEKEAGQINLFSPVSESETKPEIQPTFIKYHDNIPYISGNSIRGYLRRVMMYDFCKRVGIKKLDKYLYHQLFTGGNITESTGKESLDNREKFISMCPAIGLLGSAIGNQTIEGELKVGGARPICKEHGNGNISFWELTETKFQTRLDSSKTEKDIEIIANEKGKPDPTSQMIYQYETFIVGTKFSHNFALMGDNDLLNSAFWHMIKLFKENNYIAGNSARDAGMIDIKIDIPEGSNEIYLGYLETYKEDIQKYFQSRDMIALAGG